MFSRKKTPARKMSKAKTQMLFNSPFFGTTLMKLIVEPKHGIDTMQTNGKKIQYSPSFVDKITADEVAGVLVHEIMHCTSKHHTRIYDVFQWLKSKLDKNGMFSGLTPVENQKITLWMKACDYAINPIVLKAKFKLPGEPLVDNRFNDMSAESIYRILLKESSENGKSSDKKDSGDDTDGDWNIGDVLPLSGKGSDDPDDKGQKGVPSYTHPTREDIEASEREWEVMMVQAAQVAQQAGKLPAGMERYIKGLIEPRVPWRVLLEQFVQKCAKNDYSWMPPNRRFIHQGLYLPSLCSDSIENICIAIDTSGSITQEMLDIASSELTGILEQFSTEIDVIYCDTKAYDENVEHFTQQDLPLQLHPVGGGGTDFRPVFDWIEREGKQYSCLIYMTDLECWSYPEHAPDFPVLWIATDRYGSDPPFGEVVKAYDD